MRKFCLYIAFLCSLTAFSASYTPSSVPNPKSSNSRNYVANPDMLLSQETVVRLNQIAAQLDRSLEVELCVVAIDAMQNDYPEAFAQALFNQWGVGKQGKNTGVMILLVTDSRDIRIQTGGGMEGLLPDAICERIIDGAMVPYLSQNDWNNGLIAGAEAIENTLATDAAKAELLLGYVPKSSAGVSYLCNYLMLAFLILIVLSILVYKDTNLPLHLTHEQCLQRATGTWTLCMLCTVFFPLPVFFLTRWFYRHGGKEIQARQNAIAAANARKNANSGTTVFFGPGFGGGRRGGFGGGMGGGSFGGGMSFGGGAGHKF